MEQPRQAVSSAQLSLAHFRALRLFCGLGAALLGTAALVGWLGGVPALASVGAAYTPMAPNTALAFVALGIALAVLVVCPIQPWAWWTARVAAGFVALLGILRLCEFLPGVPWRTDHWFFATPPQTVGNAPIGWMAYQTAVTLLLASVAILLLMSVRRPSRGSTAAGILACCVTAMGLIFFLGYVYGAPFFSKVAVIPMALNTSLAFVFVGAGLIATAGPELIPLRPLSGPSVHARLLRAFLPFTALTVCLVAWLMHLVSLYYVDAASAALFSAFLVVAALGPVGLICLRIARVVGSDLERAEQELRDSAALVRALNVSLEQRVNERTRELRQLADDLAATALSESKAHLQLRSSEERFRLILDTAYEAFVVMDADGLIKGWNSQAEHTFGWTRDEVLGRLLAETIIPPRYREAHTNGLKHFLTTGAGPVLNRRIELSAVHKDGREFPVELTITPIRQGQTYVFGSFLHDISERKQAEETLRVQNTLLQEMARSERAAHEVLKKAQAQLVQTEKLAALGQVVAGVAHEINNPLSFVGNNMAVLQRDVSAVRDLLLVYQRADEIIAKHEPEVRARVHDLSERIDLKYTLGNLEGLLARSRDGLKRIQQIVKDLRDFARLDESELQDVDLNPGVESTLNIIQGQARKQQVTLELDLTPLPMISCYPAKINQVVLNLVSNAIDACPAGGKVTVGTRSAPDEVEIFVADTGSGIDPGIRQKIFDPFFTTKPQGKGTGLGLSISYGIVQAHGGTIDFESVLGRGTRFMIRLPRRPSMEVAADGTATHSSGRG